MSFDHVNSL